MINSKNLISILIPVYNEQWNITDIFNEIKFNIFNIEDFEFEIIFVNDWSNDNTNIEIKNIKQIENIYPIKSITFKNNFWKTKALIEWFNQSEWKYIITLDWDLQDDPKYIKNFLEKIEIDHLDLLVWNRTNRYKSNLIKLISSKLANFIVRIAFWMKIKDMNCWFKIIKSQIAKDLYLKDDYHRFIPLIVQAMKWKVDEIDILQRQRKYWVSKYWKTGLWRWFKYVFDLISLIFILKFEYKPFYFFWKYWIVLFLIWFFVLMYLSIMWFYGQTINARPLFFLWILCIMVWVNLIWLWLLWELISKQNLTLKKLLWK